MFCWRMELLAMVIGKLDHSCQISPATGSTRTLCTKQTSFKVDGFRGLRRSKGSKDSKELRHAAQPARRRVDPCP